MKKNYIKTSCILFFIGLLISNLNAQKSYMGVNFGYGTSINTCNADMGNFIVASNSSHLSKVAAVDVSFGKGFNCGATYGYMFDKNWGFDLGLNFVAGCTQKINTIESGYTNSLQLSSGMIRLCPSIVYLIPFKDIKPYVKLGFLINTGDIYYKLVQTYQYNDYDVNTVMNGGVSTGYTVNVGMLIKLYGKISFFGELSFVKLSYKPAKGTIESYNLNGIDTRDKLATKEKEIDYVISNPNSTANPALDSQPCKALQFNTTLDNIGFNIGFRFNL